MWTRADDIYCSSYIENVAKTWTTTFHHDGTLTRTGTWTYSSAMEGGDATAPWSSLPPSRGRRLNACTITWANETPADYYIVADLGSNNPIDFTNWGYQSYSCTDASDSLSLGFFLDEYTEIYLEDYVEIRSTSDSLSDS